MHAARQLEQCTLEEVHSLPDDGYKYELVRAQLFVTPALIAERGLVWHSFGAAEPLKIVVSELFA